MKEQVVPIVLPTYNRAELIKRYVNSVLIRHMVTGN